MSAVKHTPGPWISLLTGFGETRHLVCADVPGRIHPVCVMEDGDPLAETNARLIAAAPELLEALRGLARVVAKVDVAGALITEAPAAWANIGDALANAEAAIAKATGQ